MINHRLLAQKMLSIFFFLYWCIFRKLVFSIKVFFLILHIPSKTYPKQYFIHIQYNNYNQKAKRPQCGLFSLFNTFSYKRINTYRPYHPYRPCHHDHGQHLQQQAYLQEYQKSLPLWSKVIQQSMLHFAMQSEQLLLDQQSQP